MIQVETIYTLKIYIKFFWFHLFKGKHYKREKLLFFILVPLGVIGSLSMYYLRDNVVYLVLSFAMLFPLMLIIDLSIYTPRRYMKTAKSLNNIKTEFVFDTEGITVTQQGEMAQGTSRFKYEALYKAFETGEEFYLYISNAQAHVLPKQDFTAGTPEDLREILRKALPKKRFIVCR